MLAFCSQIPPVIMLFKRLLTLIPAMFSVGMVYCQEEPVLDNLAYNEATEAYNTATNHYENGHYFSSLKSFRKAIALNPYNSDYPFGIALSYYETKKYGNLKIIFKLKQEVN